MSWWHFIPKFPRFFHLCKVDSKLAYLRNLKDSILLGIKFLEGWLDVRLLRNYPENWIPVLYTSMLKKWLQFFKKDKYGYMHIYVLVFFDMLLPFQITSHVLNRLVFPVDSWPARQSEVWKLGNFSSHVKSFNII